MNKTGNLLSEKVSLCMYLVQFGSCWCCIKDPVQTPGQNVDEKLPRFMYVTSAKHICR